MPGRCSRHTGDARFRDSAGPTRASRGSAGHPHGHPAPRPEPRGGNSRAFSNRSRSGARRDIRAVAAEPSIDRHAESDLRAVRGFAAATAASWPRAGSIWSCGPSPGSIRQARHERRQLVIHERHARLDRGRHGHAVAALEQVVRQPAASGRSRGCAAALSCRGRRIELQAGSSPCADGRSAISASRSPAGQRAEPARHAFLAVAPGPD